MESSIMTQEDVEICWQPGAVSWIQSSKQSAEGILVTDATALARQFRQFAGP